MVKRDDKKQKKPPKGSCEETEALFEHVTGKVAILKRAPSVDGARRKGVAGPKHMPGYVRLADASPTDGAQDTAATTGGCAGVCNR